jgi:hypothetical protein
MSFEFAGYQQRSDRFQQELESPMEDVLGATAEQAITESPIFSIYRLNELADAKASPQRVDAATARQRIKDVGLDGRLTVTDEGIAEPALNIMIDRKKEEVRRQDILSRAPQGFGAGAQQLGMAFAASALDPLNVGLSFVPVVGQARYMRYLAGAKGIIGRTAVRAGVGAVEGAAGAVIIEPLIYSAKTQEQADYDFQDSLLNVAFGTVFGGGLHVLGGVGSEVARALREGRAPVETGLPRMEPPVNLKDIPDSAAARVDAMPLPEREVAMRTAQAQAMQGKSVDVGTLIPRRQTDSPEFRQWFGASRVVDETGQPLRVYHGTAIELDAFDIEGMSGVNFKQGEGFAFFTDKSDAYPSSASDYAKQAAGKRQGANVIPAFVKLEKPLIVNADGYYNAVAAFDKQARKIREQVKTGGYDGVIVRYSDGSGDQLIAAPRPEQIKSAIGNSGRFDPNSASLTDARAAADRQVSPESEVTADVPAAQAADRQLAETPAAPDPIAEQEALLADELAQLKEAAKIADVDLGDELAEFDDALKLADEYSKAARAAVLCGMAH